MLRVLLKARLLMARNAAQTAFANQRLVSSGLCLVAVFVAGAVHAAFLLLFGIGLGADSVRGLVLELFFFLFVLLFAGALPFVVGSLLHSSDRELLGATPVPHSTIVLAKVLEAMASNSVQFLLIGLPAVLACAFSLGMKTLGLLWLFPLMIAFCMLPVLANALFLLIAVRFCGPGRIRLALGFVTLLTGLAVCSLVIAQTSGIQFSSGNNGLTAGLLIQPTLAATHGPSVLFGNAFLDLASGHYSGAAAAIGALLAICAGMLGLCLLIGASALGADFHLGDSDHAPGSLTGQIGPSRRGLLRLLPMASAAVCAKDFRCIVRDGLLLSQLGMPMLLFLVPFVLSLRGGMGAMGSKADIFPFAAGITGVILFMQTSIVSLTSVGMESRAFWVLRASPNRFATLLRAKFLVSAGISAGVGTALTLVASFAFGGSIGGVLASILAVTIAAAGLCGIGVGIAALLPKFHHENPSLRVSPWAMIISFFASVFYVAVGASILVLGLVASTWYPERATYIQAASWTILVLMTAACVAAPITAGAARLDSYQWEH